MFTISYHPNILKGAVLMMSSYKICLFFSKPTNEDAVLAEHLSFYFEIPTL